MRCKCCDTLLTNHELTLEDPITGEPLDTCEVCIAASDGYEDYDEELDSYDVL